MPGIPPDCDRLAEKLARLQLGGGGGGGTSVCRFKSVPTSVIADRLAHARHTRVSSQSIPCCFSMFCGEFCLRLKPPMYWPNIVVKYAFWLWCFAAPTAGCVLAYAVGQETLLSLMTLRQANMGYAKNILYIWFSHFHLNRDTSVLELFPVVVFQ